VRRVVQVLGEIVEKLVKRGGPTIIIKTTVSLHTPVKLRVVTIKKGDNPQKILNHFI